MTAEDSQRERLHRLGLLYVRYPIYFVTACTHRRQRILATDAVHGSLLEFGREGGERGVRIGGYILMPDHLHLFIALDDQSVTLARVVKSLKNTLSKAIRTAGVPSPHWQKGFFDHVLRSGESYSQKWQYVRDNPIRAGLVSAVGKWPFSGEVFSLEYLSDR